MLLDQNAMLCKIAEQLRVMLDGDPRSYEVNKSIAEVEADADKLHRQISRTLSNGLIVPKFFFMAVLCKNNSGYKAMAFWIEHKDKDTDFPKDSQGNYMLSPYVTNVRELETLTGIDFFCNLDDETENHVETLAVENIKSAWGLK